MIQPRFVRTVACALSISAWALLTGLAAPAEKRTVRLATLAPKGSSFHQILLALAEQWRDAPEGGVTLKILPDGTMGAESDIVSRIRIGQLQAGVLTVTGLADIDKAANALQNLPLVFRTLDEAAYVRERLRPMLEKRMEEKGFVLLFLGDVGWVRFFSKQPILRPNDLKKVKLFTWAGATAQIELMKSLDLKPVALEIADVLPGLQTGLIDAVPAVPFFALAGQFYLPAPHMLNLEWAPLVGGGVISKKVWDEFPPALQAALRASALAAGKDFVSKNRVENEEAIAAMQKRGLTVHPVTPEIDAAWRAWVEPVYPRLRGLDIPADLFDEVFRALAEHRSQGTAEK